MSREDNKQIARRFVDELWNQQKLDVADELVVADKAEAVKGLARVIFSAFPDFKMDIDMVVAGDDRVGVRCIQSGTHKGDLFGVGPTGKQASWNEMMILRIEGGKIAEAWFQADNLSLMQQLGAMPSGG